MSQRIQLKVVEASLNSALAGVNDRFRAAQPAVQGAMRDRFYEMVMSNFGVAGADRPWHWQPLSPAYAKKVGRDIATLYVSGALKDSVMKGGEGSGTAGATVSMSDSSVPYATAHHRGVPENRGSVRRGLPARRVFPLTSANNVMPYTREQVVEAARSAAVRLFS